MEVGVLGSESLTTQSRWYKKRTALALGGEKIGDYAPSGMTWIDGFRCPNCRLLILRY